MLYSTSATHLLGRIVVSARDGGNRHVGMRAARPRALPPRVVVCRADRGLHAGSATPPRSTAPCSSVPTLSRQRSSTSTRSSRGPEQVSRDWTMQCNQEHTWRSKRRRCSLLLLPASHAARRDVHTAHAVRCSALPTQGHLRHGYSGLLELRCAGGMRCTVRRACRAVVRPANDVTCANATTTRDASLHSSARVHREVTTCASAYSSTCKDAVCISRLSERPCPQ